MPNQYNVPSKAARVTMQRAIAELEGSSLFDISEHFYGKGVCFNCGAEREYGCEPDAQYYECDECGKNAVFGYELAMMHVLS